MFVEEEGWGALEASEQVSAEASEAGPSNPETEHQQHSTRSCAFKVVLALRSYTKVLALRSHTKVLLPLLHPPPPTLPTRRIGSCGALKRYSRGSDLLYQDPPHFAPYMQWGEAREAARVCGGREEGR